MAFYFSTPSVDEGSYTGHRLFDRISQPRGISVLVTGGVATQVRFPTQDELAAADFYFLGGSRTEVTAAQKTTLEANGYTVETV